MLVFNFGENPSNRRRRFRSQPISLPTATSAPPTLSPAALTGRARHATQQPMSPAMTQTAFCLDPWLQGHVQGRRPGEGRCSRHAAVGGRPASCPKESTPMSVALSVRFAPPCAANKNGGSLLPTELPDARVSFTSGSATPCSSAAIKPCGEGRRSPSGSPPHILPSTPLVPHSPFSSPASGVCM